MKFHFSSLRLDWQTPKAVYQVLDSEFQFDDDPCPKSPKVDGLMSEWGHSNFVICQMFGDVKKNRKLWKIKKGHYKPLAFEAQKKLKQFSNIQDDWIPREDNDIADELSKAKLIKAGIQF